jgi:hypothetical protein
VSPKDLAFVYCLGGRKRRGQDLLIAKQKVKLHEHQFGNHNLLTRSQTLKKLDSRPMQWRSLYPGIGKDVGIDTDHSANRVSILTNEIAKNFRIMHKHLGSNRFREFPSGGCFLFERGVGTDNGFRPLLMTSAILHS